MTKLKHIKFPNGFQIIYQTPNSTTPISCIQVFCNIGNVHATKELNGVTHFIEHMCFNGNKKHPDFTDVLMDYANIGAEYNGLSNQRLTYYTVKCQDIYVDKCIQYMAEELLNSLFDHKKFKKEEKVVIEENVRYSDNPVNLLDDITKMLLYENTRFEYPTDNISYHKTPFDYKKVLDFYKANYVPSNMVLSIVTNTSFAKVVSMVKKTAFYKVRHNLKESSLHDQLSAYLLTPPLIAGPKFKVNHLHKLSSIFLNVAFQTCNQYNFKDKYILKLISNIVCNSYTSRLTHLLREKYGLVYGIKSTSENTECGGDFIINTQFDAEHFIPYRGHSGSNSGSNSNSNSSSNSSSKKYVLPTIIKEFNNLIKNGVTQREITLSKNNIKGNILLKMVNIDEQTNYNGEECLLHQSPETIVPYEKIYDVYYHPITKTEINECLKKYFSLKRMSVCILGDKSHIPPLKTLLFECNKFIN
jgi:predicted Zn-dependent peptidase